MIRAIQEKARSGAASTQAPRWADDHPAQPERMDRTERVADGKKVEDFWRAHQVPVANCRENDSHRVLED